MDDHARPALEPAPEPQASQEVRATSVGVPRGAQAPVRPSVPTANAPTPTEAAPAAFGVSPGAFAALLENHFAGIVVYDRFGNTLWSSSVVCAMTGHNLEERQGLNGIDLVHPDDVAEAQRLFLWVLEEPGRIASFEQRIVHKSGRPIWVEAHLKNLLHLPEVRAIVGNYHEITDRKAAHEALLASEARQRDLANQDHLTGLGNRRAMIAELERASQDVAAGRLRDFAFYFLDLDGFKNVNDRLGHAFGDEFLRQTAARLRTSVPAGDVVARIGGDEFAVLARSVSGTTEARALAAHIVQRISDPVRIRGQLIQLPGCVGVVTAGRRAWSPLEFLRYADTALYAAKQEGAGHVRVFDRELEAKLLDQSELAGAFGAALERGELDVHYQPIVDLGAGRVAGLEALVRWHHPTRGLLPAGAFVPAVESTGLVIPMGEWVFERACADAARWAEHLGADAPWVSANLSSAQLIRQDFGAFVRRVTARHGLRPGAVRLELTESGLFDTEGPWRDRLRDVEAAGIPLMLDDFGTGYTSMRYLSEFPIAMLKLDKSYVHRSTSPDAERRERALQLVRAVGRMSRSLGIAVVAEGIESEAQHRAMVEAGCQYGQGWHYERALPASGIDALLRGARDVP